MNKYYFTFGLGHVLARFTQPILADSMAEAEKIMFEKHGSKWACGYEVKPKGLMELPLCLKVTREMTEDQKKSYKDRFESVLSVTGKVRTERLKNLMFDLDCAFDLGNDKSAKDLYIKAGEELSESLKGVS